MSLLLRVSRNCPWNKCAFCAVYKASEFSRRDTQHVLRDIDTLAEAGQRIRQLARHRVDTGGGSLSQALLDLSDSPSLAYEDRRMAMWLHGGGKHVFLQDADSLIMPNKRTVPILEHLYLRFPTVDRVTTYARSRTLFAKTPSQLNELRAAGLTRIHVGVESGSEDVLRLVAKGCRPHHHVDGCRKAMAAGFDVCCYVMPGLGGVALSSTHASETAKVLRAIAPHHIRLRTLWIDRGSPLMEMKNDGRFTMPEEHQVVEEILTMVTHLEGIDSALVSDHDRNLLMDLEGHLTTDIVSLKQTCTDFLQLPPRVRDAYVVARRSGYFRTLNAFLGDPGAMDAFIPLAAQLKDAGFGSLAKGMASALRRRHI